MRRYLGIIRRIDDLGRIIIPKELRRRLSLHADDPMEIFIAENEVILKRYAPYDVKHTGIIRRIDDLGRIAIPKELRRKLSLHAGDPMEIFITENEVILK